MYSDGMHPESGFMLRIFCWKIIAKTINATMEKYRPYLLLSQSLPIKDPSAIAAEK
jgi:hypothetical protein